MKHSIIGIALALALVMGVAAFAETTEPVPAVTEEMPAESNATEDAATEAPATRNADDSTALQEAMEAYRAAKESERVDDLTGELNGYVEAGKLTQEQADLILNSVKERMAAKNGECPNCGYQFQNNTPRMGGQKGPFGGNNQCGGPMNGQQQMPGSRMNGQMPQQSDAQQPGAQNGAMPNGPMNGQQQAPQR